MADDGYSEWLTAEVNNFLKGTVWRRAVQDGKEYYYDKQAKKSHWKKPAELAAFEATRTREVYLKTVQKGSSNDEVAKKENREAAPVEPAAPAKVWSKEELESVLAGKDSILERNIVEVAQQLIRKHNVPPATVIKSLSDSYTGYPAMIQITLQCLKLANILTVQAQSQKEGNIGSSSVAAKIAHFKSDAYSEEVILPLLAELISQRFNRKAADALVALNPPGADGLPVLPEYVHKMMQDPVLSAALRDLYQVNEHSVLLRACCSGKYNVQTSEGVVSSSAVGARTAESAEQDLKLMAAEGVLADCRKFGVVRDLVVAYQTKNGDENGTTSRSELLSMLAASSEQVKLLTLHLADRAARSAAMLGKRWREEGSDSDDEDDVYGAMKRARMEVSSADAAPEAGVCNAAAERSLWREIFRCETVGPHSKSNTPSAEASDQQGEQAVRAGLLARKFTAEQISALHRSNNPAFAAHPAVQGLLLAALQNGVSAPCKDLLIAGARLVDSETQEDELDRIAAQCKTVSDTFLGVVDAAAREEVLEAVRRSTLAAAYVLQWCRACAVSARNAASQFYDQVLHLLVTFVDAVVRAQPLLLEEAVGALKVLWKASQTLQAAAHEEEDAARASLITQSYTELQRELVQTTASIVIAGCVRAPMQFLEESIDALDIDLARLLLHSLLPDRSGDAPSWVASAVGAQHFIRLLHTDRAQNALKSKHFSAEDRQRVLALLQGMQADVLDAATQQQQRADLLHLCTRAQGATGSN